jgi:phospholipid/cholesterol/gamma-HCH transport system substrate-binding protein
MRRQIERYGQYGVAIIVLMVVAVAVAFYILIQQHLTIPFQSRYTARVEFTETGGVTPGLNNPVAGAGVRVGTITDVKLENGRAVATMQIDPKKLPKIDTNAHAVLVPFSPLKYLYIDVTPGGPPAPPLKDNGLIPLAQTTPPVNSDELTDALDADTRQFFEALVGGTQNGLRGRGHDLRALLKALGPTTEQINHLGHALVKRRHELKRMVHNLGVVSNAVGRHDTQLAGLVSTANTTVGALASQEAALRESVGRLPGTLSAARSSLKHITSFSGELTPTLNALTPTVRRLPATLKKVKPFAVEAEPILRTQLRPFIRDLQPLVRGRGATVKALSQVTPGLGTAFQILTYVANEFAYNPPGDNEGFAYWTSWFAHNGASFVSTQDANGVMWRGNAVFSCQQLNGVPGLTSLLGPLFGTLPVC